LTERRKPDGRVDANAGGAQVGDSKETTNAAHRRTQIGSITASGVGRNGLRWRARRATDDDSTVGEGLPRTLKDLPRYVCAPRGRRGQETRADYRQGEQ
jgi:hypothetical protein